MKNRDPKTVFQQAVISSILKDYDAILAEIPSIEPSEDLKAWMQNEIKVKKQHITRRRVLKSLLIAVLIITLLAISAMAVPAIRKAFIQFFLNEHTDHYSIVFDTQQAATAPQKIEDFYCINYVPKSFSLIFNGPSKTLSTTIWASDNGSCIQYTQRILPENPTEDNWTGIDYVSESFTAVVNNHLIQIIPAAESIIWIWTNNSYVFTLYFPADLPDQETIKIFESWSIVQK